MHHDVSILDQIAVNFFISGPATNDTYETTSQGSQIKDDVNAPVCCWHVCRSKKKKKNTTKSYPKNKMTKT